MQASSRWKITIAGTTHVTLELQSRRHARNDSPCAPAEARQWFFWGGKLLREILRNFAGSFWTHKGKAQKFRENFRALFLRKPWSMQL